MIRLFDVFLHTNRRRRVILGIRQAHVQELFNTSLVVAQLLSEREGNTTDDKA
jgi:hypothetical protein